MKVGEMVVDMKRKEIKQEGEQQWVSQFTLKTNVCLTYHIREINVYDMIIFLECIKTRTILPLSFQGGQKSLKIFKIFLNFVCVCFYFNFFKKNEFNLLKLIFLPLIFFFFFSYLSRTSNSGSTPALRRERLQLVTTLRHLSQAPTFSS